MRLAPIIVFILMVIAGSPNGSADDVRKLDTIRWILGDWARVTEDTVTSETWAATNDGIFVGKGTTTSKSDNHVGSHESLLLVEMDGDVFYIAKVKQNKFPVSFKLTSCSSTFAVFENKEHDFPKKLEYRLSKDGKLNVTVSDGAKQSFAIPFSKVEQSKPKKAG